MDGGVGFDEPELSWSTQDIEQKIGFSGGRYTDTNAFFTFLVGLILRVNITELSKDHLITERAHKKG